MNACKIKYNVFITSALTTSICLQCLCLGFQPVYNASIWAFNLFTMLLVGLFFLPSSIIELSNKIPWYKWHLETKKHTLNKIVFVHRLHFLCISGKSLFEIWLLYCKSNLYQYIIIDNTLKGLGEGRK